MKPSHTWISPAVFGAFDGLTSSLGVLLGLAAHPHLVLPAAVGVGAAEMVGMAAGQWQSDSEGGIGASLVIGTATGAGCILPAVPFALVYPTAAATASAVLVLTVTAGIAQLRAGRRGRRRAVIESYLILAATTAVVLVVHVLTPGGGA